MTSSRKAPLGRRLARAFIIGVTIAASGCFECCGPACDERVSRWLNCTDCLEGEIDSLLALNVREPDWLRQALASALFDGPSQARRDSLATFLGQAYTRDSSQGSRPDQDRRAYTSRYLGNYTAVYRKRAAFALARIGTPQAKAVLDSAAQHVFPPSDTLRADVRQYLARMQQYSPPPVFLTPVP